MTAAKGKSAGAQAQLSYTKIVSPIDGVVTDRPVYPGETPAAGTPIVTVMNLSQVVARAHISQQEASAMKAGDPATISVPGQSPDVKGKVTLVSPALDPNSTTVEVWVQAPNAGRQAQTGASVRVTIVTETVPKAIVAPAAALLTDPDGITSVIALDSDNKPTKKHVKVGIRSGDDVQITERTEGWRARGHRGRVSTVQRRRSDSGQDQDSSASAEDAGRDDEDEDQQQRRFGVLQFLRQGMNSS